MSEFILNSLKQLRPDEEEILLIEGTFYVVRLAEVADVERVASKFECMD
jgi:hypothetical protein